MSEKNCIEAQQTRKVPQVQLEHSVVGSLRMQPRSWHLAHMEDWNEISLSGNMKSK